MMITGSNQIISDNFGLLAVKILDKKAANRGPTK